MTKVLRSEGGERPASARFRGNALVLLVAYLLATGAAADRFGPPQPLSGTVDDPAVCAGDIDGDGDQDVLTVSRSLHKVTWYENLDGRGTFGGEKVVTTLASGAYAVHAADLDGDGDVDVLSAGRYGARIAWYENMDGHGRFGGQRVITLDVEDPKSICTADVDGDGDQDVLSSSEDDDKIAWYENTDGRGNFGPQHVITTTADGAQAVHAADLDGDGDPDVLSASQDDDKIAWYENTDGLGGFGPPRVISAAASWAQAVHAADLDGDGDLDVLAASSGSAPIAWFENTDGGGTFGTAQLITTQVDWPVFVHAADLDCDGDADVLSASLYDDKVAWYENLDGAATFGPQRIISSQTGWASHALPVDLDNDGDPEVLSTSWYDMTVQWHENADGLGGFGPAQIITSPEKHAMAVHAADLDGDGDLDAVASFATGGVVWYPNRDGQGRFGPRREVTEDASGINAAGIADLDGDGDVDVIVADYSEEEIAWYENLDGFGTFGPRRVVSAPGSVRDPRAVYTADMDGDGDHDVLSASSSDDKIAWYENVDGLGNFGPQRVITILATEAFSVVAADLDGDGDEDVLATAPHKNRIVWFPNLDGHGNFGHGRVISWLTQVPIDAIAADVDGDGDLDVLSGCEHDERIAWYENTDGLGTFAPQRIVALLWGGARKISTADLDGDGDQDVLACSVYRDLVTWYENTDGLGTFGAQHVLNDKAIGPFWVTAADLDNDDDLDVLSASHNWDFSSGLQVAWYDNRGNGALVSLRASSANAMSHTAVDLPVLGGTYHATVDLGATGHSLAWLAGFAGPDYVVLPGTQVLLVDVLHPDGELLALPLQAGPVATFAVPIPSDLSLTAFEVFTQAMHVGGGLPFVLSNAQDLYLGL